MTTLGFVASWVLFFIAGIMILGPELGGDDGSKVKGGILMVFVSFLTSVLLLGLSALGSA